MPNNDYYPPDREGTPKQRAQYWLEKAVDLEKAENHAQSAMAFKALKHEGEAN